jgi:hypothetical protein
MMPFLIGDALKIAAALPVAKALRPMIRTDNNTPIDRKHSIESCSTGGGQTTSNQEKDSKEVLQRLQETDVNR